MTDQPNHYVGPDGPEARVTRDKLIILGDGEDVLVTHQPAQPERFYPYEFYVMCLETDYDAQISVTSKLPNGQIIAITMSPSVPLGMLAAEPRIVGVPIEGGLGEYIVKVTGAKGPWAFEARGTCVAEPGEEPSS